MLTEELPTAEHTRGAAKSSRFQLPAPTAFFSRQWWWTTLLVLAAIAVMARLGVWQLDRLEQRRAHNADIMAKLALPPLLLNAEQLPDDLSELKNRTAIVKGEYDLSRQMALTNQNWATAPGFHLITPLVLDGGARSANERPVAVLVDRGWLPAVALDRGNWARYDSEGTLSVEGYIKLSQTLRDDSQDTTVSDAGGSAQRIPDAPQSEWYRVDVADIGAQLPYELLPVYMQQSPLAEGNAELPFQEELDANLSEGNHFSYAVQWFIFATILGVGYVFLVGKRTADGTHAANENV